MLENPFFRQRQRDDTTINNGDPDEIEAYARELLAHAEAERAGH